MPTESLYVRGKPRKKLVKQLKGGHGLFRGHLGDMSPIRGGGRPLPQCPEKPFYQIYSVLSDLSTGSIRTEEWGGGGSELGGKS